MLSFGEVSIVTLNSQTQIREVSGKHFSCFSIKRNIVGAH